MLVKDDISEVLRQRDNRGGNLIAGLHFVEEAVALLVHQNRPAAADRLGNQIRGLLLDGRVNLDFAHIHRPGPDAFKQRDTAAGRPSMVGGHEAGQIRAVFHHHRAVGAEAAGSHDNALRLYHNGFLFIVKQAYAAHLIVGHQDLFNRRIQQDIDPASSDITHQAADQVAADRRPVARTVGAVDAHPAGSGDIVKHNAATRQPLNGFRRIFHEAAQQLRVVFVLTAFQRFLVKQLFAIFNTFHALEAGLCGVHPG